MTKRSRNLDRLASARTARLLLAMCAVALQLLGSAASTTFADDPIPGNQTRTDKALAEARFDQKLNAALPADVKLRDEAGAIVALGDYFGKLPVVLVMAYFNCPNLCPLAIDDLVAKLAKISYEPGRDFNVVVVSIDPRETPKDALAKRRRYLQMYGRPQTAAGWHFLTGPEAAVRRLADTIGFHYTYDKVLQQYAHPSGVVLVTPEGKVGRYLFGLDYTPTDLRFALIETSAGRIGTPIEKIWLRCYHYDSLAGKYTPIVMNYIRLFGLVMMSAVGGMLYVFWRGERRRAMPNDSPAIRPETV